MFTVAFPNYNEKLPPPAFASVRKQGPRHRIGYFPTDFDFGPLMVDCSFSLHIPFYQQFSETPMYLNNKTSETPKEWAYFASCGHVLLCGTENGAQVDPGHDKLSTIKLPSGHFGTSVADYRDFLEGGQIPVGEWFLNSESKMKGGEQRWQWKKQ